MSKYSESKLKIEVGLQCLIDYTRPGTRMTCAEIAEVCDCHKSSIQQLELSAQRKFRKMMDSRGIKLNDLLGA